MAQVVNIGPFRQIVGVHWDDDDGSGNITHLLAQVSLEVRVISKYNQWITGPNGIDVATFDASYPIGGSALTAAWVAEGMGVQQPFNATEYSRVFMTVVAAYVGAFAVGTPNEVPAHWVPDFSGADLDPVDGATSGTLSNWAYTYYPGGAGDTGDPEYAYDDEPVGRAEQPDYEWETFDDFRPYIYRPYMRFNVEGGVGGTLPFPSFLTGTEHTIGSSTSFEHEFRAVALTQRWPDAWVFRTVSGGIVIGSTVWSDGYGAANPSTVTWIDPQTVDLSSVTYDRVVTIDGVEVVKTFAAVGITTSDDTPYGTLYLLLKRTDV